MSRNLKWEIHPRYEENRSTTFLFRIYHSLTPVYLYSLTYGKHRIELVFYPADTQIWLSAYKEENCYYREAFYSTFSHHDIRHKMLSILEKQCPASPIFSWSGVFELNDEIRILDEFASYLHDEIVEASCGALLPEIVTRKVLTQGSRVRVRAYVVVDNLSLFADNEADGQRNALKNIIYNAVVAFGGNEI